MTGTKGMPPRRAPSPPSLADVTRHDRGRSDAVRAAARKKVRRRKDMVVNSYATVQPCPDGAFVDVTLWIPWEDAEWPPKM